MRKSITFLISIVLVLTFSQQSFGAVPKFGSSCTKLGSAQTYQGKKFTCIKSGRNLIWDKGVPIPKPMTTPSTSPISTTMPTPQPSLSPSPTSIPSPQKVVFSPWSSDFLTSLMTNAALDSTSEYFGKVIPSSDYEIIIDPAITNADRTWITSILDYANGSFMNIQRDKLKIFLGTSHAWSKNTLSASNLWIGDPHATYPCSQGINDAYCAEKNLVLLIYSDIYSPNSQYRWDFGRRSTPAHEVFHTIQFALAGPNVGGDNQMHIPRWLMEGSANFFGFYVADRLGFDKYQTGRNQQINNNSAYMTTVPLVQYDNFTSDPYGIGQAATEYLIASIGFEKFLNIWKFTKSESSFALGFKKATGLTIEDFYSKFEAARKSMHIGY